MIIMSLTLCSGRVSRDTVYQYEYPCQLITWPWSVLDYIVSN